MTDYRRVRLMRFAPLEERETPEARFWRKFKRPVIQRLLAPATSIEFNPLAPHDFAVTAGARVLIFDAKTSLEKRALSKFKDTVYSGSYRADGRLLCAGSARGVVHAVDVATRATLRQFRGHRGPVHAALFGGATQLLSAGDDTSVRFWDMTTGAATSVLEHAHGDYVRCAHYGGAAAGAPHLWATGSYDHTVRLWDARAVGRRGATRGAAAAPPPPVATLVARDDDGDDGDARGGDNDDDDADDAGGDDVGEAEADDDAEGAADAGAAAGDEAGVGGGDDEADDGGSDDDGSGASGDDDGGDGGSGSARDGSGGARAARAAAVKRRRVDVEADIEAEADSAADGAVAAAPRAANSATAAAAAGARRGAVLTVDHGEPVSRVLLMPGGSTLLTAGGSTLKLWDLVSGGRLLLESSPHQKAVTSLVLDGAGSRVLSGGLDGFVKVHELGSLGVTASVRYDAPVVALAVSPDNTRLVVGTGDGALTTKSRVASHATVVAEAKAARVLRGGSYRYFLRGQATAAAEDDIKADVGRKQRLAPYDAALRGFAYGAALDAALASGAPLTVASLLEELVARGPAALRAALAGRDEDGLDPVLAFLVRHVVDPRFAPLLLDVTGVVLDMYAPIVGQSAAIDARFHRLARRLADEASLASELLGLQGQLDLLLAASTSGGGGGGGAGGPRVAVGGEDDGDDM